MTRKPRTNPAEVTNLNADKGYDYRRRRSYRKQRGVTARIARTWIDGKKRLGIIGGLWRAACWLTTFGTPRNCFEKRLNI